jgi:hypothetical protein
MTTRRSWRSFVVQLQWIEMRTGLERATSCHDHDGFQASPRQTLRRSIHVDATQLHSAIGPARPKGKIDR